MRLLSLKCPDCQAQLQIEEGRKMAFCTYCGAKIVLEEADKVIRVIDEAELRRIALEEKKYEDEKKRKQEQQAIILKQQEDNKKKIEVWKNGSVITCAIINFLSSIFCTIYLFTNDELYMGIWLSIGIVSVIGVAIGVSLSRPDDCFPSDKKPIFSSRLSFGGILLFTNCFYLVMPYVFIVMVIYLVFVFMAKKNKNNNGGISHV